MSTGVSGTFVCAQSLKNSISCMRADGSVVAGYPKVLLFEVAVGGPYFCKCVL